MDSAGAFRMNDVMARISTLVEKLDVPIGIHAHNNLGLSVANSLVALDCGRQLWTHVRLVSAQVL